MGEATGGIEGGGGGENGGARGEQIDGVGGVGFVDCGSGLRISGVVEIG